jgi:hypothetical protein
VGRARHRRRRERLGEDAATKDLVAQLAARRTPLLDAQKAISDVTGTESQRQKKAKLLFAGLFLNDERSEVMRGIERYFRKQKEFSAQIRSTILQLRELQDRSDPDQSRVDVCEVPVVIEQRLFALARAIQQSLE